jgi:hypothetical protein
MIAEINSYHYSVGSTTYTYTIQQLDELLMLVQSNRSVVKALSVWLELHPCSAKELIDLWGYHAERFALQKGIYA